MVSFSSCEKSMNTFIGSCEDGEFYCSMEDECIPIAWKCDGEGDCVGDEDEKGCPPGLNLC